MRKPVTQSVFLLLLAATLQGAGPARLEAQEARTADAEVREVQVLLEASPFLTRRVRPLFLRPGEAALSSPILGSGPLAALLDRATISAWPGLPGARSGPWQVMRVGTGAAGDSGTTRIDGLRYMRVEWPSEHATEWRHPDGGAAWTVGLAETPAPILSLAPPIPLPRVPSRIDVRADNVVWVIRHGDDGEVAWAVAFGPIGKSGPLTWRARWSEAGGQWPDDGLEGTDSVPPELVRHAIRRYAQVPRWSPTRTATGALKSLRYNRVEGASVAVPVWYNFSPVVQLHGEVRLSTSSYPLTGGAGLGFRHWPVDFGIEGYRTLMDANRWEAAERKLGNSVSAFLYGQDHGHYFTAEGGRLYAEHQRGLTTWRVELFGESDEPAHPRVDYALFPKDSADLAPGLDAEPGEYYGLGAMFEHQEGLALEDGVWVTRLWARAAGGTRDFVRVGGVAELLKSWGRWAAAARLGGGVVFGDPPVQRQYFVGGGSTVRGVDPATLQGPALALARLEAGYGPPVLRAVVFGDMGWAGTEETIDHVASVGAGVSLLEGFLGIGIAAPVRGGSGVSLQLGGNGLL